MDRPSWDQWFMEMAFVASLRSTCLRRQIGAVLVKDYRVLSIGYSGPPPGLAHCEELGGCLREKLKVPSGERHEICRAVHAETNCLLQAARMGGIPAEEATLYVTTQPCSMCARAIAAVGVRRVVIVNDYPDEFSEKILAEAGIRVDRIERWKGGESGG